MLSLFKSRSVEGSIATEAKVTCSHYVLVPTWANAEDMGKESLANGYRCYACGNMLSLDEAKELRGRNAYSLC